MKLNDHCTRWCFNGKWSAKRRLFWVTIMIDYSSQPLMDVIWWTEYIRTVGWNNRWWHCSRICWSLCQSVLPIHWLADIVGSKAMLHGIHLVMMISGVCRSSPMDQKKTTTGPDRNQKRPICNELVLLCNQRLWLQLVFDYIIILAKIPVKTP